MGLKNETKFGTITKNLRQLGTKTEGTVAMSNVVAKNMSAFRYNESVAEKIDSVCAPLYQHFGISHVGHIKLFNNKTMFRMANNKEWTQNYFEKGYYNDPGLYNTDDVSVDKAKLVLLTGEPHGDHLESLCKDYNIWNALAIYEKYGGYTDFWFFGSNRQNGKAINFYINNLPYLKKFILYFKEKLADDLNKLDSQKLISLDLPEAVVARLENDKIKTFFEELNIKSFKINDNLTLSKKEFECIFHLTQGRTAKEIALFTGNSFRTIQAHIERLKDKIHCQKKSQLSDYFLSNKAFQALLPSY